MDEEEEDKRYLYGSITVRIPPSMHKILKARGKSKRYHDKSDACRAMITLGLKIDDMMQIYNDPEKKKEFQDKFFNLVKNKKLERDMESMTDDELNTIIFFAQNLRDKKVEQLLLDLKRN